MKEIFLHGGKIYLYKEKYGTFPEIDFSANINPLGLGEKINSLLKDFIDSKEAASYPDSDCRELYERFLDFYNKKGNH